MEWGGTMMPSGQFDRAIDLGGGGVHAWLCRGIALDHLGKPDQAIACYDKVLEADPHQARAWYLKGRALDRLGRFADAVVVFSTLRSKTSRMREWRVFPPLPTAALL
jgi:Putative Zn-dependent protease, contains TPR repeats